MAQEQFDNREYSGCLKGRSGDWRYLGGLSPVVLCCVCSFSGYVRSNNRGNRKVAVTLTAPVS